MTAFDLGLPGARKSLTAVQQRVARDRRARRMAAARAFAGGATGSSGAGLLGGSAPILSGWRPPIGNANVPLNELPQLRERCRDAALNSSIYRAIRRAILDHVVGETGLLPKSAVDHKRLGVTEVQAQEWAGACDELFESAKDRADVTGRMDWAGTCALAFNAVFDGGDTFPSFPITTRDDELMARINLIEAERVGTPHTMARDPLVQHGVKVDKWGAPEGFWVTRHHPGAMHGAARGVEWEFWRRRVPLTDGRSRLNVIQLYDQERIGQARGVPAMNPVLDLIDRVPEYADVTLEAAEAQTRLSIWLLAENDPNETADLLSDEQRLEEYGSRYGMGVDSAAINVLNRGDDIKMLGSQHPGSYFDAFVVRLVRLVCSVSGVPYAVAFSDTQQTNYSSMRSERATFQSTVGRFRKLLLPMCRAWREHLIYDAWLDGRLPAVRFEDDIQGWLRATWNGPRMGHIDPTKEMKAYSEAISAQLMSRDEVIQSLGGGRTVEDVMRELAKEQALAKELGLGGSGVAPAAQSAEPEEPEDEQDESDPSGDEDDAPADPEEEGAEVPE